jgi:hypothetical protein
MRSIKDLFFENKLTNSLKKIGRKTMESGYITNKMLNKDNMTEKEKLEDKKKDKKRLLIAGGAGLAAIGARKVLQANNIIR